jgi:hypothetical protein
LNATASRRADAAAAGALTAGYIYLLFASAFSRREWADTIAYGLPGANFARFGTLALPQLGSQFGFDRFWLFNAPWVVVGYVPTFWITGAGRIPHLAGIVVLGLVNWIVFSLICRRLFALRSITAAMLVAYAFLGTRGLVMSDLYNQKYSVVAYALLLVAFLPISDPRSACGRPWWQWLTASLLPLLHIVIPPAAVIWLAAVVATDRHVRGRSLVGPALYAAGGIASVAWYFRPGPFLTQLWPHIAFGGFREAGRFSGLLDVAASTIAAVPTWILAVATVVAAVIVLARATRPNARDDIRSAAPAAALIAVIFVLDAWRGYLDFGYFITGVGPIVFAAAAAHTRVRQLATAALVAAGVINIGISTRLDRLPPDWTTTSSTEQFLMAHTREGDTLVVGPPFVFAASAMPPERAIARIVPQPYFLETFDRDLWVRDLNTCCNVYVGDQDAYTLLTRPGVAGDPIFPHAEVEHLDFHGQPVLIARRR